MAAWMLVIDPSGSVRPIHIGWESSDSTCPAASAATKLIQQQGYVGLDVSSDTVAFHFDPARVHPNALSRGIDLLFAQRRPHVDVASLDDGGSRASFESVLRAIQHICDLTAVAASASRQGDFKSRPLKREQAATSGTLAALSDIWSIGERRLEQLQSVVREANSRLMVVVDGNDPLVTFGGFDFQGATPGWREAPTHFRLADWPDVTYGRWVAEAYREAWQAAQPRLDALDCILKWPGREARRYTYRRLMLPCETMSGSQALLSVMHDDPGIDLRTTQH